MKAFTINFLGDSPKIESGLEISREEGSSYIDVGMTRFPLHENNAATANSGTAKVVRNITFQPTESGFVGVVKQPRHMNTQDVCLLIHVPSPSSLTRNQRPCPYRGQILLKKCEQCNAQPTEHGIHPDRGRAYLPLKDYDNVSLLASGEDTNTQVGFLLTMAPSSRVVVHQDHPKLEIHWDGRKVRYVLL